MTRLARLKAAARTALILLGAVSAGAQSTAARGPVPSLPGWRTVAPGVNLQGVNLQGVAPARARA